MRKWSELMEENREKIADKMVDAFKEAEGGMSGWRVGVEMDQDGDVWTTGIMSQGSQSESSWKGETTIVDWIATWNVDYDEENFLSISDYSYLEAEFERYKEENDDECLSLREFMIENHSDILEAWDKIAAQDEIDAYYDNLDDKINEIIEQQKEYESYEEN